MWKTFLWLQAAAPSPACRRGGVGVALAWPGFVARGRMASVYVAHLEKDCSFLGLDTKWRAEAATTASHGLPEAGDRRSSPTSAIADQQPTQIVIQRG